MTGLWSAEQHEWLRAMGLTPWRLATPEDERGGAERARAAAAELLAPVPGPGDAAPARPVPPPRRPPAAGDRLGAAIARAARRREWDADLAALLPDPSRLRGDAAGKRALWPRLRALRRGQGGA
ncbi:hypothetical protein EDC50_1396 [Vulcaniibacterium tengchongense]|uniref:Uncharacterized protein n=1 Tax=Vulcaniibacterium tengchongense TaxID=1273429 RepID=A0A3N4VDM0_9GAMM|nr:hypothetical protein [Vulcaniibacterium tengchongense]RPE79575.1 hypothetical protein EDC50_1396 [Vulcaniibacterium tengchongense]